MEGRGWLIHIFFICFSLCVPGYLGQTCDVNTIQVQDNFEPNNFAGTWFYQGQLSFSWVPRGNIYRDAKVIYQTSAAGFDALWFARFGAPNTCQNGTQEVGRTNLRAKYSTRQAVNETDGIDVSTWIVATDYRNYAVIYGCERTDPQRGHCLDPIVATLSRERNPAQQYLVTIEAALDKLCLGNRRNRVEKVTQNGICETACDRNPCQSGGACNNWRYRPYYFCWCTAEYTGFNCETRLTGLPCDARPCFNGATCENRNDRYNCICTPGYTGQDCRQPISLPCDARPCFNGATCENSNDRYNCICTPEYTGQDCRQPISKPCDSSPCLNGRCTDIGDTDYRCDCPTDFTGRNCRQRISLPCDNPSPCRNGATCTNLSENDYQCTCPRGFLGTNCEQRRTLPCDSQPCLNGGSCSYVDDNSYACSCTGNYEGLNCEIDKISVPDFEDDTCILNPCYHGGKCKLKPDVTPYGLECQCPPGTEGIFCQTLQSGMQLNNDNCPINPCAYGGICRTTDTELYQCLCPSGYSGLLCDDALRMRPCESRPCVNGQCTNDGNSFICQCRSGFTGRRCEDRVCDSQPCLNQGTCQAVGSGYTCICQQGWTGLQCQDKVIDFLACDSSPCLNSGTCENLGIGVNYRCTCTSGYTGQSCESVQQTVCAPSPCLNGGSCFPTFNSYYCQCTNDYSGNRCESRVEPCDSQPCLNQGTCENTGFSFRCRCLSGYSGFQCQTIAAEPCDSSPCMNGGTCRNDNSQYRCTCSSSWMGADCTTSRPTGRDRGADIFFIIDTSSSIGNNNFRNGILPLIASAVQDLEIGPNHNQVGIITFSREVNVQINLDDYPNKGRLIQTLLGNNRDQTLSFDGQTYTKLTGAITEMEKAFMESDRNGNVPKLAFIFMDGGPSEGRSNLRNAASAARAGGVKLFAIGIGEWAEQRDLDLIASDPKGPNTEKLVHYDNIGDQSTKDFISGRISSYSAVIIDGGGIESEEEEDSNDQGGQAFSWSCDFENGLCNGMTQSTQDDFDWTVYNRSTPSSNTGPNSAYSGNYFAYLEATNRRNNDECILLVTVNNLQSGVYCLRMAYSMYGHHVRKLEVKMGSSTKWECTPDQDRRFTNGDWKIAQIQLNINQNSEQLQFIGVRGNEYASDIAIDDLNLEKGACTGGQSTCPLN